MSATSGSSLVSLILAINIIIYTDASPQHGPVIHNRRILSNNRNTQNAVTSQQSSSFASSLSNQDFVNILAQSLGDEGISQGTKAIENSGGDQSSKQNAPNANNIPDDQLFELLTGDVPPTCHCTPINQCRDEPKSIISGSSGIIAVVDVRNNPCPDPLQVCCTNRGTTIVQPITQNNNCGVRNPNGVGVSVTGFEDNQAQYAEFPWTTVVMRPEFVGNKEYKVYACGGSLIHPRIVVTVAHCVFGKSNNGVLVRVGDWNINSTSESYPHAERNIQSIVIHPNYQPNTLVNDVALLILSVNVPLQPNIGTICLPNAGEIFDGSRCYSSGWGKDVFGKQGRFQQVMKEIDIPVVAHKLCEASLKNTRLKQAFTLHNTFICAGGEGKDTCVGDGGSPLACPSNIHRGRYTLAGAVAWGIGCGQRGVPGVYASISAVTDWIKAEASSRVGADASKFFS